MRNSPADPHVDLRNMFLSAYPEDPPSVSSFTRLERCTRNSSWAQEASLCIMNAVAIQQVEACETSTESAVKSHDQADKQRSSTVQDPQVP